VCGLVWNLKCTVADDGSIAHEGTLENSSVPPSLGMLVVSDATSTAWHLQTLQLQLRVLFPGMKLDHITVRARSA
jgi:hypothetical protein